MTARPENVRRRPNRRGAILGAIAASVVALFAVASPAAAHDYLVSSTPNSDETVTTELTAVQVTFSDKLLQLGGSTKSFAIQVTGPDDRFYGNGCVDVQGSTASTSVSLGETGQYTVTWQVVSSDGHPTSDTYSFSYTKPAAVAQAAGASTPLKCGESAPAESASTPPAPSSATPAPSPAASEGSASSAESLPSEPANAHLPGLIIGIVMGVLLVAAIVTMSILMRRRKQRSL